jgi:hypothetical protein
MLKRGALLLIFVAALGARLWVAYRSDYIFWPDEIFQVLEPAHRKVFGYGLVAWELYYGARPFLPALVAEFILHVCKWIGCDKPTQYIFIMKVVFSVFSSMIVLSGFYIGKYLKSERAGLIAAFFCGFWYELLFFAPKPEVELLSIVFFLGAFALSLNPSEKRQVRSFLIGAFLVLAAGLRVQYSPLCLILGGVYFSKNGRKVRKEGIGGVFFGAALFGISDWMGYGIPFISQFNNALLNVFYHVANGFGTMSLLRFYGYITVASSGLLPIALMVGSVFSKKGRPVFFFALLILLLHSFFGHKEYRFILGMIPLVLIGAGIGIDEWEFKHPFLKTAVFIGLFLVVSFLGIENRLFKEEKVYSGKILARSSLNQAFLFLSEEPGVQAVADLKVQETFDDGGYYYLHRDIPLYGGPEIISLSDARKYASHIVCDSSFPSIEGFETIKIFGDVEIRKQNVPPGGLPRDSHFNPFYELPLVEQIIAKAVKTDPFLKFTLANPPRW